MILVKLKNYILKQAIRLLPNNKYVGISITQGNLYRKKTLPLNYFIEVAKYQSLITQKPVCINPEEIFNLKTME